MLPPLTDLVALLGITLVLCAGCLRLLGRRDPVAPATRWARWVTAAMFLILWCPVGEAHLPLVAYLRGISSDLSITLVAMACMDACRRLFGLHALARRERMSVDVAVAASALFLYPLALGWGDWDLYRWGWGGAGMWAVLLTLSLLCWARGLRLLPVLVALALLAWTAGLLESTNLWDYLMDPWLATAALLQCAKEGSRKLQAAWRPIGRREPDPLSSRRVS